MLLVLPEDLVFPEELVFPEAPLGAFSREAWVTPVALAICFRAAWVSSFSPRSALLMSEAVTPAFSASWAWVRPAPVRAS